METDKFTIQDIFQKYGDSYVETHKMSKEQWKVYNAIRNCKTKELGIHKMECQQCGETFVSHNSCRNRHCPMCQGYAKEKWIENESKYLLDAPYFHVVTTVPSELNEIFLYNQKECYKILQSATAESVLELCKDKKWLGGKVGITSILHTWGQTMEFHPHIHSIVTGGGLTDDNKWVEVEKDYLIKVQVLTSKFRGKFLAKLKELNLKFPENLSHLKDKKEFDKFLRPLYNRPWVTYIEPPKGSPENVIEYIGRYSFRVAISNDRIKSIDNGQITFEYKDYRDNAKVKEMTISAHEFIRRFLMHVLPSRFTKIKHYGLLANRNKKSIIKLCRILIKQFVNRDFSIPIKRKPYEFKCPKCGGDKFYYTFYYDYRRSCLI